MNKNNYEERRKRNIQKKFRVTKEENEMIMKKMELAGFDNLNDYLVRMAIDGFIIIQDFDNFIEVSKQIHDIGIDINKIAHRCDLIELQEERMKKCELIEGLEKPISIEDIKKIDKHMENIWNTLNEILRQQSGSIEKEKRRMQLKKLIKKEKGNLNKKER